MTLTWSVPHGQVRPLTAALQGLMVTAGVQRGCAGCSLTTTTGPRLLVRYIENWDSEADLRQQLLSDRFLVLAELIEYASEPPIIEFALPERTRGLEYAEEVRRRRALDTH